jgi:putative peptidoglycan binding protein
MAHIQRLNIIIMKNLTSLLMCCSLALAGAALAQQPVEQQSPSKTKHPPEKARATEAQPRANAAKPQERPAKQTGPIKERGAANAQKSEMTPKREKAADTETNAAPPVSAAGQQNARAKGGAVKKPDPQQVQQIKSQHANFRAQPKPQQVQAVTFNQNYRIQGSEQWQGPQYEVFRSYQPQWHDEGWYRSHYSRVELIGDGYYFFNNGYWFPAWGYSPSVQYYAYDGPIYVGHRAELPDQVIADVQAELQQMGYYKGEVDGLLGPLTREALAAYQADQGLTTTAVIDEPTLDSLGLA